MPDSKKFSVNVRLLPFPHLLIGWMKRLTHAEGGGFYKEKIASIFGEL